MNRSAITLAMAMAIAPGLASAHEYWLEPSRGHAARGDSLTIRAIVGMGFRGEPRPWAAPRALRFEARGDGRRDLRPAAVNGDAVWARVRADDAGGIALAYQGDFAFIELPATEFEDYLRAEGLDAPRRARAVAGRSGTSGRERYARCARTWIGGSEPARVMRPDGLTLELVPLADPATAAVVPFELRLRGEPLAGALVRAWRRPPAHDGGWGEPARRDSVGVAYEGRTDARGRIRIPMRRAGAWLVSAVHMEPSSDPQAADWQSWWASFTFSRPAAPARARR